MLTAITPPKSTINLFTPHLSAELLPRYKQMKSTKFTKKILLGTRDNVKTYLEAPRWSCDWYWSFGRISTKTSSEFITGCYENRNLHSVLTEDFELEPQIKKNIWTLCELIMSAIYLKDAAEVLGRGGAHYSSNPCKDIITNNSEVERINTIVLPSIFDKIQELIG
jgi:hypothetical protein